MTDHYRSARQQAEDIRTGRSTSRDALEAQLERIESVDGPYNTVIAQDPQRARADADAADARRAKGEKVIVLDVRTEDALSVQPYQIPEARWLPLAAVVEQAHALPRQGTIVTY